MADALSRWAYPASKAFADTSIHGSEEDDEIMRGFIEEDDRDARRVMEVLRKHRLVANKKKCRYFVREVEFCGHILGGGKRRPAPGKLMALEKWEEPKTVTALRGFLGFTN